MRLNLNEQEQPVDNYPEGTAAKDLLFTEIPQYYRWLGPERKWVRRAERNSNFTSIARLYNVAIKDHERFYLRMLCLHVRGATSFADMRTVNGTLCDSNRDACLERGLLKDDAEWHGFLEENHSLLTAPQMRNHLFDIFNDCHPSDPHSLFWDNLSWFLDDFMYKMDHDPANTMTIEKKREHAAYQALYEIDLKLAAVQQNLHSLDLDSELYQTWKNTYIQALSRTAVDKLWKEEVARYVDDDECRQPEHITAQLHHDQRNLYQEVIKMVDSAQHDRSQAHMIFADAPGGTGKTFTIRAKCAKLRNQNKIVVPVASSGIAAHLLPGGRTAHSRFSIPIPIEKTCRISGSPIGELFRRTSLIIIDEASMLHRNAFESIDRTLRDITRNEQVPFGGIPVLFSGDFRQILPVVKQGGKFETLEASLQNSYLWSSMRVIQLKENMRIALRIAQDPSKRQELEEFGDFLLRVGDNTEKIFPDRGQDVIKLPKNIVSTSKTQEDFVNEIFPNIAENFAKTDYLCDRSILVPLNKNVTELNHLILAKLPGLEIVRHSVDTCEEESEHLRYSTEFMNSLSPSGIPQHELVLKVGAPIMLLRNLSGHSGACNGAKLIIKSITKYTIRATFAVGEHKGELMCIPRIPLKPSDHAGFEWTRQQFPVRLCFAMTIHKSQGQTLKRAGVYLPAAPFTHGQLYVALSRVGSPKDISVFIDSENDPTNESSIDGCFTRNIIFSLQSDD